MKTDRKMIAPPSPAVPDDRGRDGLLLARALEQIDTLAQEKARQAEAVVVAARADDDRDAAERANVERIEEEARKLEVENRARLAKLLLRQSAYGAGAFALAKLLRGQFSESRHKTARPRGKRGGR